MSEKRMKPSEIIAEYNRFRKVASGLTYIQMAFGDLAGLIPDEKRTTETVNEIVDAVFKTDAVDHDLEAAIYKEIKNRFCEEEKK